MAIEKQSAALIANKHPKLQREILRCEVGSTSHGVALPGNDDFDMMAIGVEHPEHVLATSRFEHYTYRTAEIREGKKSVPSQPGDVDLVVYSLRKFAGLAAHGNPSVMLMLYAPVMRMDEFGMKLRENRDLFASKDVGRRFLGYMKAQKERLKGERGQMRTTRQALIDEHGFDTKYAMHVLRLGYQGTRFMETGEIECPIDPPMRNFLLGVRRGQQNLESVLMLAEHYERSLATMLDDPPYTLEGLVDMPDHPDMEKIDNFITDLYLESWGVK